MVESYVVDASVVAKWFNRGEEFEKESDYLRRAWISDKIQLESPSHLLFEVASSVWKNPNIGIRKAASLAKVLVEAGPSLNNLTESMAEQTMLVARRRRITFYDASYLTLARLRSLPLISVDNDQLRAASGYVRASHLSTLPMLKK